jgi:oligopeptide transport system substrate-binding protein
MVACRPDLVAAPNQNDYPNSVLGFDPERAAALVEEVKAEGVEIPEMTLLITSGSATGPLIAEAMQQMWAAIGIDSVVIQEQEFAVFLDTTGSAETNPAMHILSWCLDYPDANNFLYDVFHSSTADNWGFGWTNAEFDSLIEQAQVELDTAVRTDLYAQAENILINQDAVIAPLWYTVGVTLTKPYVERPQGRLSTTYFEFWQVNR